jgi:hypothetical protein
MALYFTTHPRELIGRVIELGAGIGLGGILLTNIEPCWNDNFTTGLVESITLTDGNDMVLRQCRQNVVHAFGSSPTDSNIHVSKLDWNELANAKHPETYDTVLACDCVYRFDDIPILAQAMTNLLDETPWAKIHLFSPLNRAPLQDMMVFMKKLNLQVSVETVEINRYRLKPGARNGWWHQARHDPSLEECSYASKAVATFLHITATHNLTIDHHAPLSDVD